jgi:hypothetical protein
VDGATPALSLSQVFLSQRIICKFALDHVENRHYKQVRFSIVRVALTGRFAAGVSNPSPPHGHIQ